ncbi:4369_t:CDS:2, partial [Funneliformis geosporum]
NDKEDEENDKKDEGDDKEDKEDNKEDEKNDKENEEDDKKNDKEIEEYLLYYSSILHINLYDKYLFSDLNDVLYDKLRNLQDLAKNPIQ